MKKGIKAVLIVLLFVAAFFGGRRGAEFVQAMEVATPTQPLVWIDPGHGGADPGKVGVGDVLEKDLNLAMSLQLKDALEMRGIAVEMTRTEDEDLADEGASSRKMSDLNNRCKLMNASDAAFILCIHQNSFTDPAVKGAQVFYCSGSEEGADMAKRIQEEIRATVDPENKRETKENDSYYMLKNTGHPIVIVECGFLSNPEETALLTDPAYQAKLVTAIADGVEAYFNGDKEKEAEPTSIEVSVGGLEQRKRQLRGLGSVL